MTLDDLYASLPNGFHDANFLRLTIDYQKAEAQLVLDVWVAESLDDDEREAYRLAELTLSGLLYWIAEPPNDGGPLDNVLEERIDMGPLSAVEKARNFPALPHGAFANYIFLVYSNTFIYVAARDAALQWIGEKRLRV
jgi:hypothetical protein